MVEGTQAAVMKRSESSGAFPQLPPHAHDRASWGLGGGGPGQGGRRHGPGDTGARPKAAHTHTQPLNPPAGASDSEERLLAEDDRQESGVGGGPDEEDQMSSEAEDVRMGARPGWTCSGARESCRWGGALHACGAPQLSPETGRCRGNHGRGCRQVPAGLVPRARCPAPCRSCLPA